MRGQAITILEKVGATLQPNSSPRPDTISKHIFASAGKFQYEQMAILLKTTEQDSVSVLYSHLIAPQIA
jgi:hypothetical protein